MKPKSITRRGIAKDLAVSPYTYTNFYNEKKVNFQFSSKLHLEKFIRNREDNYKMIYNYIIKRFKFNVDCRLLSDCNLYYKIEKRGFCIKYNDVEYNDRKQILIK